MPGGRKLLAISLCGVFVATVTACSSPSGTSEGLATYDASGAGPGGDAALLQGSLSLADQCLTVTDAEGVSVVPLFPEGGATWDGETLIVFASSTDAEQRAAVGEDIELAGGFRDERPERADVPSGCPSDALFFQIGT